MSVLTETMERLDKEGKFEKSHLALFNVALAEHEEEIRNKAIDEFAEKIMEYCSMSEMSRKMIRQIAEQMKGGV